MIGGTDGLTVNELRRMAYLEAMGIDSYVSRAQLPGAAASRRLAIVRSRPQGVAQAQVDTAAASGLLAQAQEALRPASVVPPRIDTPGPAQAPPPQPAAEPRVAAATVPRFTLAAIASGGYLWLEQLGGHPLATEQVQLVKAMAGALGRLSAQGPVSVGSSRPEVALFNWPIHNNRQLDQSEEAARACVAGFIARKLDQLQSGGLVLLGQHCASRVPVEQLADMRIVTTVSTAEMLADPMLKKQAWLDLQSFARSP